MFTTCILRQKSPARRGRPHALAAGPAEAELGLPGGLPQQRVCVLEAAVELGLELAQAEAPTA